MKGKKFKNFVFQFDRVFRRKKYNSEERKQTFRRELAWLKE